MKKLPKLLIFDVNETLLALTPIKTKVNEALQSESAFDRWFSAMLHYSLVETTTGVYKDFGEVGKHTLRMVSKIMERPLSEKRIDAILSGITTLSPHAEVEKSLQTLKDSGFLLVALTNGGQNTVEAQLDYAKLAHYFDRIISVEQVKKFKPHPNSYQYVLDLYAIKSQHAMLIAAHGWDIYGAQIAGLQTGFIARKGKYLYNESKKPDYTGEDLWILTQALTTK